MRAPVFVGAPDRSRSRAAREFGPVGGNRAPLPWRDGGGEVEGAPRVALPDALLAACAGIGHGRAVESLNLCKLPNAKPVPVDAIVLIQNKNANCDVLLFFYFGHSQDDQAWKRSSLEPNVAGRHSVERLARKHMLRLTANI